MKFVTLIMLLMLALVPGTAPVSLVVISVIAASAVFKQIFRIKPYLAHLEHGQLALILAHMRKIYNLVKMIYL